MVHKIPILPISRVIKQFKFKMLMIRKCLLYCSALLLTHFSGSAGAAQADDIRIVIDVSGSMVKTDPNNLRVPALRMINGLLPTGSKAGVWTFGRYVNMEVKWGSVNDSWRKQADEGASKIHSRGQFTNIESALKRTTTGWDKPDSKTRRNIILLTDGQVDISKDPVKNNQSRSNILSKTIPRLVKNGINVHTIALSSQSDEDLLKRIALKTSGSFEIAHSAKDLQRIFLRMFEKAAKPDTVPLTGNKFTIDKSIKEMTLLVFQNGGKKAKLIQPDGKEHSQKKHGSIVRWRTDQGYDLITIKKPMSGEWTLDAKIDPDNRVMIVTDLKLMVEGIPAYSVPDQDLLIRVELHNKSKKISKNSFLKFVKFNVTHKTKDDKKTSPLGLKKSREVKDKGIYLHQIKAPIGEGSHEIVVNADARTFNRSKRFKVEVQWPVIVEINKGKKPGLNKLTIKAREEYIQPQTLQLSAKLKQPDGQLKTVTLKKLNGLWMADLISQEQDGLHELQIGMKAKSVEGIDVSHQLDGYSVLGVKVDQKAVESSSSESLYDSSESAKDETTSPEIVESQLEESESTVLETVIYIVGVNVILILIAGGIFLYLRKKKSGNEVDLLEEDEEVNIDG